MTLRWICLLAVLGPLGFATAGRLPPCRRLNDEERVVCTGCVTQTFPSGCDCYYGDEPPVCPDKGLTRICALTEDPEDSNEEYIVSERTVKCYHVEECKAENQQQDCSEQNPCTNVTTGQSTTTGTQYYESGVEPGGCQVPR